MKYILTLVMAFIVAAAFWPFVICLLTGFSNSHKKSNYPSAKMRVNNKKDITMTPKILACLEDLEKHYAALLETAEKLSKSNFPAERALAYEITVFVASQTAATQKIINEISTPESICEKNGYGALVD